MSEKLKALEAEMATEETIIAEIVAVAPLCRRQVEGSIVHRQRLGRLIEMLQPAADRME